MKPRRLTPPAALLLAALAGCAVGSAPSYSDSTVSSGSPLDTAQRAQAQKDNYRAARAYEEAAQQASGSLASDYHLHAAEAAADGNDYTYASTILDALPLNGLEPEQQLRWRILRARVALARNDAAGALHLLPDNAGSSPLAERVLLLRGRALFHLGDAVGATTSLVQRERLLPPGLVAENHDTIWSGLIGTPLDSTALGRAANADPVSRGWIELANLTHRNASLDQYESWRQRYPGHPAQDRLASVMMQTPAAGSPGSAPAYVQPGGPSPLQAAPAQPFATVPARPGFYALLLPQSGGLANVAESLRAGFAAAAARAGNPADVRVYDAAGNAGNTLNAYNQALGDGAGVVVGPLLRGDVASLSQAGLRTPVLALNYLDAGHPAPAGFYQFGMAPEDEARAAAEDAVSRGLRRALVLVPESDRGSRILAAFQQRMAELGGEVRESRRYSGEFESWSEPIKALLHYHQVEDKKKLAELRATAQPGIDVQRRNDFDFIFMDAGANQARQLWPLFRYYHAERMAIYDTAGVNEGHGDPDLSGIRFCDAPWMLDNGGTWAALRADALNGRRIDQARFFALGDDAFQLAQRLSQNSLHPQDELPGASGTLRVGEDGAVHRSLVCARTTEGQPQVLEPPGAGAQ
jgi:outer membrane PBP1 activator LpoA protein